MQPTTCRGVVLLAEKVANEQRDRQTPRIGHGIAQVAQQTRQGFGVHQWPDGCTYEGHFIDALKHGKGRYSYSNGQYYEGCFFKDYKHGDGLYCWPTGHKFTGKFYLNRKEGYGEQVFPDGATFQGLYHSDQRFGPGVVTYPDGQQDVGLWLGQHLLKLCTCVEESFSLSNIPGYAAFLQPSAIAASAERESFSGGLHRETRTDFKVHIDLLSDDSFILPPGIESYTTDGDHLPLPPGRRRELDQHFYGEQWELDAHPYQGYEREPLSTLPLQARMQAHIHRHRLQAENVVWNVAAVLSMNREDFGPKGPVEVLSELFIQHSFRGELQAVSQIFQTRLVHPDVADSQGHTALIAATINCHNDVIHLLLDMGVDINKLNNEGMSALAVCYVLYYPFHSLHTKLTEPLGLRSPSLSESSSQTGQVDFISITPVLTNKSERTTTESRKIGIEEDETGDHVKGLTKREARGSVEMADVEHSIQVLDGHISLRSGQWKETPAKSKDEELTPEQSIDSACLLSSCNIVGREEVLQRSAEALSHTGVPQGCDTQEPVCKTTAMKIEHRVHLNTLKLLLERGADPNLARVPVPVLFLAIMAGDPEAVKRLLLSGARTDIPLPLEKKGLYPLHVAAAVPGPEGPVITELLLHTAPDPDMQACDQDEIYEPDRVVMMARESLSSSESSELEEGGRTALHVACQRNNDYLNASKVVSFLLSHRASTNLLWSGHSPLSLAIANGNDLAVQELLNRGADPNTPLGPVVGSALCALANINYQSGGNKIKMLDMLVNAGADILKPVMVGDVVGTAVDYAYYCFKQSIDVAHTSVLTRDLNEKNTFRAHQLLKAMTTLLRQTASQREREGEGDEALSSNAPETAESYRKPVLKFCYHCGRSVFVKLTACTLCHKVFHCSRSCQNKAWEDGHRKKCVQVLASDDDVEKNVVSVSQGAPRPLSVNFKSLKGLVPLSMSEKFPANLKENYSYN